jgi:hypothetical protein
MAKMQALPATDKKSRYYEVALRRRLKQATKPPEETSPAWTRWSMYGAQTQTTIGWKPVG